jgi:trans-2,3-dihydro-3-hydroxyanthranilate isomerase
LSYTRVASDSLTSAVRPVDFAVMDVRFRLVDVFTEVPFAGNQLCVVPVTPDDLDTTSMQTLAREIGFSETTFVSSADMAGYRMRIFTPDDEIPFAGHPTLGTAFALASEGLVGSDVVQTTTAGDVRVEIDLLGGSAVMHQLPPVFGEVFTNREAAASAAGLGVDDLVGALPIQPVGTGLRSLMVPVKDEATLRRAERDARGCAELAAATTADTLYFFVVRGDGDVMARMFDPGVGIGEDPATGSAAGPLGAYLAANDLAGAADGVRITVAQGEMVNRPSFLHVDVARDGEGWSVRVSGGVQMVGEGSFRF